MRRFTVDERRARLGWRHRLAREAAGRDVVEVARGIVAFHATDPASVYLSARARLLDSTPDTVSTALYDDRTLLRMLGMRRTMFVLPTTSRAMVQAAATDAIAERETRRLLKLLADVGIEDPEGWLRRARADVLAALATRGEALASELSTDVPALRTRFTYAEGKAYANNVTFTTQVMNGLSALGPIVRGRPRGSWAGSQYRWSLASTWLAGTGTGAGSGAGAGTGTRTGPGTGSGAGTGTGTGTGIGAGSGAGAGTGTGTRTGTGAGSGAGPGIGSGTGSGVGAGAESGGGVGLSRGEAQADLVRAWLGGFGPGTVADIKWWTGLGLGEVRRALAAVGAVEVELEGSDGGAGVVLPGDDEPVAAPEPWIALLPALDATPMGWYERSWYLGEHREMLFDRNGNIGPTVWSDGRIVGGWAQYRSTRKGDPADGEIVVRLLEDVGAEKTAEIEAEAEALRRWIGDVRFTPRFRTPVDRELTAPRD